jgi:hypothetical protein
MAGEDASLTSSLSTNNLSHLIFFFWEKIGLLIYCFNDKIKTRGNLSC